MMRFLIRSGIPETPGTTVSTCEKKVVLVRDQKMWREKREGGGGLGGLYSGGWTRGVQPYGIIGGQRIEER